MFGIGPRVRKSTPLLCLPFSPSLFLQFRVNNERAAFGIPSAFTTLTQGLLVASAWSVFYICVCVCVSYIYVCRILARMCTPMYARGPLDTTLLPAVEHGRHDGGTHVCVHAHRLSPGPYQSRNYPQWPAIGYHRTMVEETPRYQETERVKEIAVLVSCNG